jgi:hypothetical protein
MRKVVLWCYLRQHWFVWDHQLKAEVGWFAKREAAVACAGQGELF